MFENVLLQRVEKCMGHERVEQLNSERKGKELGKESMKGLLLDFAIVLFYITFKIEKYMNKKRDRNKGEIEDLRKRKENMKQRPRGAKGRKNSEHTCRR